MRKGTVYVYCKGIKKDGAREICAKLEDLYGDMFRLSSALACVSKAGAECSTDAQIVCVDMSCTLDLLIEEVERYQGRIEEICAEMGRCL